MNIEVKRKIWLSAKVFRIISLKNVLESAMRLSFEFSENICAEFLEAMES